MLGGKGPEAARNAVLMTAAAALYASGVGARPARRRAGRATEVLAGGGALGVLETLRRIAPRPTPPS